MDILIAPGAPFYLASFAGALLAAIGLILLSRQREAVAGVRLQPSKLDQRGRVLVGNLAGIPIAAILVLMVVVGGIEGMQRTLFLACAGAAYLYLAVVIPRRAEVKRQKDAVLLRKLTPGFIGFIKVGMSSGESPLDILRRYVLRPVSARAVMQELVADALRLGSDQRMRPFAALCQVAQQRGCRELVHVTQALAQAEREGARIDTVLDAQQETLTQILQSEFKRMLRRRTMYLLMMVAISLVVGILFNLLVTMVLGSGIIL